jgi:hypothetical protein
VIPSGASRPPWRRPDGGGGHTDRVLKVKFWNPDKAIELTMKYFGAKKQLKGGKDA